MQTIFVSNRGDDINFGLTKLTPIRSWKRCERLCRGRRAIFLMEGEALSVANRPIPLATRL